MKKFVIIAASCVFTLCACAKSNKQGDTSNPTMKIDKTKDHPWIKQWKEDYHILKNILKNSQIDKIVLRSEQPMRFEKRGVFPSECTVVLNAATTKVVLNLLQSHLSMPDKLTLPPKVNRCAPHYFISLYLHTKNKEISRINFSEIALKLKKEHWYYTMDKEALKELRLIIEIAAQIDLSRQLHRE